MKTVAKVFLWIEIVGLSLLTALYVVDAVMLLVALGQVPVEMVRDLRIAFALALALILLFVWMLVFNINNLQCLNLATAKTDIKIWRIVLCFLFSNFIVGLLFCFMEDKDFVFKYAKQNIAKDQFDKLEQYRQLLDEGMITKAQYDEIKQTLLQ